MRLKHVKGAEAIIEAGKYYVSNPRDNKGKWASVFGNDKPIKIEIGMGKGDFIIENALKYPDVNFIGIEKYDSVIVRAIQKSQELDISNLRLIRMDAMMIDEVFSSEVDTIYLNFSDPWPKDRHAKRRLTSPIFLFKYDSIFKGDNHIIMKTDNNDLFAYSLDSLRDWGYSFSSISHDLHSSDVSLNIMTEYEKKFVKLGVKINMFEAFKKKSINDEAK